MCAVLFAISVVDAENSAGKGEHLAASHKHRGVDFAGGVYAEPGHCLLYTSDAADDDAVV